MNASALKRMSFVANECARAGEARKSMSQQSVCTLKDRTVKRNEITKTNTACGACECDVELTKQLLDATANVLAGPSSVVRPSVR
jgi:hypothetical protein